MTPRQTSARQNVQQWGIRSKNSNKQCLKALQKIRQQRKCIWNAKNWSTEQMKQQNIAHGTSNNTSQNAVIFTITKTAPPICRFLVQKQIKHHRTKGKLQCKRFSNKNNARNNATIHEKAFNLGIQTRSEPDQRCSTEKNRKIKILFKKIVC